MDPLTALVLAAVAADVLSRGWVHTVLGGAVAGSVRETGRQLAWSVPDPVRSSRAVRAVVGTGRLVGVGVRSAVRGVRYGGPAGARSALAKLPDRRQLWADRRGAVRDRTLDLARDVRSRATRDHPESGSPPSARSGSGPVGDLPRPGGPGSGGTGLRPPARPVPGPPETGPGQVRWSGPRTEDRTAARAADRTRPGPRTGPGQGPVSDRSSAPDPGSVLTLVREDDPDPGPVPDGVPDQRTADPRPDPTDPTLEDQMAADLSMPRTVTEDVPTHIAAGLDLAVAIEDVAEQYGTHVTDTVRAHIASAEGIQGFPPSLQGEWIESVQGPLEQAMRLIQAAAEAAQGISRREATVLLPSVEAADAAPADSDLRQSDLRSR